MTAIRDVDTTVYRLAPAARCEQCDWWPGLYDPHLAARRHTAETDHQKRATTVSTAVHDGDECWADWHFEAFDLHPYKCDEEGCP